MYQQLTEDPAQFSLVFTLGIGLCKSFYFSPINCAVSSVNRSVKSVLINVESSHMPSIPCCLCQNKQEKLCPSVLHWRLPKLCRYCGTNNVPPSVQIIVQCFTQFCAQAACTVKLSMYGPLRIVQFFTQFWAQATCTVKLSVYGPLKKSFDNRKNFGKILELPNKWLRNFYEISRKLPGRLHRKRWSR